MHALPSIQTLASNVLTRVQRPLYETKSLIPLSLVSSLSDDFEERLASGADSSDWLDHRIKVVQKWLEDQEDVLFAEREEVNERC